MEMLMTKGEERLRKVWRQMRSRCSSPKNEKYSIYGGRGITVCAEWSSYTVFRAWAISAGYTAGLTIDRIDNDGNYEPGNCHWITAGEQMRNKSNTVYLTAFGETKDMVSWSEDPRCVVSEAALRQRVQKRGWDVERALTEPEIDSRAPKLNEDQQKLLTEERAQGALLRELAEKYNVSVSMAHRYVQKWTNAA